MAEVWNEPKAGNFGNLLRVESCILYFLQQKSFLKRVMEKKVQSVSLESREKATSTATIEIHEYRVEKRNHCTTSSEKKWSELIMQNEKQSLKFKVER